MEHEAYETAMPQAHTIIFSIPMAKQCYCSNNIFCWKNFCEIVTNLLEDLLHQAWACTANSKKADGVEAALSLQKVGLLRYR